MIRTGTDIVDLKKFRATLEKKDVLRRVFQHSEMQDQRIEHLAGIFAAKEAVFKALGRKCSWKEIEIAYRKRRPYARLPDYLAKNLLACDVSIAHDGDYAIAIAIVMTKRDVNENRTRSRIWSKEK